jgi:outer membrane receptor protein involved in Fe transport
MTRRSCFKLALMIGMIVMTVTSAVLAHTREGSGVAGTITTGPRSEPVANARVTLQREDRTMSTTTDARGRYSFAWVEPGEHYVVTVDAEGLRSFSRSEIAVEDGEIRRVDANLELAVVHYSVAVNGRETDEPTTTPRIGRNVTEQDVADLPSVTRSTTKYALLDPHVRQVIGLGADFQDATRLSVNAASYRHTGHMLDGMSTYDWIYANNPKVNVSPGAVREIQVLTGPTSAQYGMSTTGILSVVTASGGETLRGDVFVFARPSSWQERPPLATFDVPNERFASGARAGGPLRPARTYFFATYERADQERGAYIQSPSPGFFIGDSREQYGLARFDQNFSANHFLTLRLNGNESTTNNANDRVSGFNQPSFGRISHAQSLGGQVSDRLLTGTVVNELRGAFTAYTPDSARPIDESTQVVRPNYSTEGYSTTNWVHARSIQIGDTLTLQHGRHAFTIGGEIVRVDAHDYSNTPLGTYTFAPGPPRSDEHPLTYTQTFGTADLNYGQTQASVFVQDELRLSNRLTASFGLRYEIQSITDDRANFAPRAGFSWDVAGDGRTVVRSAAGVFFDQYYMYLTRRYITLGPTSPQASYAWSWGDPGFPNFPEALPSVPSGKAAGSRDIMIRGDRLHNPRALQFSVGVERQIRAGLAIHAGALSAHTVRQMRVDDINHPEPFDRTAANQIRTPQAANLTRPYSTYEGVAVRNIAKIVNTAESTYRSLDLGFTARFGRRSTVSARYVWSSSIAYSMFYADANSGVPNEWWPDWDRFERGPSDFHQPYRLIADASVSLPFDTQLSTVVTAASGLPLNPVTGRDNNGDSYGVDRPVGLDRNSFRGPAQVNVDLAGVKRIPLGGRFRAEARLEIFNLFNRANFIKVNGIYGEGPAPLSTFLAPVAGITNTDPSRQIQVAVKLIF